jgi:F-box protein 25/32
MPFLGRDWRSEGEKWIKTEQGWERTKVLECIPDHINSE